MNLKIITVYDNNPFNESLKPDWGFSCVIRGFEKTILFDTGRDGQILLSNMEKLGINPEEIELIFLSHEHYDHTGGIEEFLNRNCKVEIWLLECFSLEFKNKIKVKGVNLQEVKTFQQIIKDVYTTGILGSFIKEQSLVLRTEKGLVVITGCAHPGITFIVSKAKEMLGESIYLIIGGFHMLDFSEKEIKNVIKEFKNFGVQKVAPCHCSGRETILLFEKEFKNNFIKTGVGRIIEIK